MKRIYVGNLPPDVRTRDVEDLFYKFGKIAFIDLKNRRGPPFAFVEFHDYRDAEEAVRARDGKKFDGCRLRVEFPRGRERPSRFKNGSASHGAARSAAPQRRSKYRVKVSNLPTSGSWQDLKDHMREFGEVCFADVYKGGEGVVEFVNQDDMRYAIRRLHNTKFKSHEGETSYIKLREDIPSGDSRSRSRSPIERTRRRSRSPVYDKDRSSPPPSRRRRGGSSNNRRPISRSRSRSRSPRGEDKARSRSRSGSDRSDRASLQSRDRSRSRSPRSVDNDNGRSPSPVVKDEKPQRRQRSATPNSVASGNKDKPRRRTSASPARREDDNHRSRSRSPRQRSASPGQRSGGDRGSRSPSSRSGSYTPSHSSRSNSRTPTPVED